MAKSILIKNPLLCVRMKNDIFDSNVLDSFSGGHVLIEDNKIMSAGPEEFTGNADKIIDASRMIVLPGFINTHHHFYQTLTRNILSTQKAELFDWLLTNYEIWREISGDAFYVSAKLAISELLKSGCTTSSDHLYLFPNKTEPTLIDREIEAAKELGLRFQPTRGSMSMGKSDGGLPPDDVIQTEDEIVKDTYRLIKKYHDNSFGAMTRISLAPCSPFSVTPELMRKTAKIAKENNLQLHTHLAETKDEVEFCKEKFGKRPYELIKSLDWLTPNSWFAHSIFLNEEEIKGFSENKVGVSHCPSSNMRLGSGIAPIKELLNAGVNVSIGVDGSASNDSSNMLLEMRNAMLLSRLREPNKWLSTEEVLWMATVGGAKVLGRNDIGQIAPGKCADITMISMDRLEYSGGQHDPAGAIIFDTAMNPIDYSIINGKVVVENGKIVNLNEKELIAEHQKMSDELIKKAERNTGKVLKRK
ncbi:MAG: 8-oxoguanine deaminase [Candidatus Marinimicrobia bacterium]|nr:8-oxoguanine deaminase [Candidatus Neomarinimicrobiota bacterium]